MGKNRTVFNQRCDRASKEERECHLGLHITHLGVEGEVLVNGVRTGHAAGHIVALGAVIVTVTQSALGGVPREDLQNHGDWIEQGVEDGAGMTQNDVWWMCRAVQGATWKQKGSRWAPMMISLYLEQQHSLRFTTLCFRRRLTMAVSVDCVTLEW